MSEETIGELYNRLPPGVPVALPEYGVTVTRWKDALVEAARGVIVELDARDLAVAMHRHLCKLNHMDGCGWEYEIYRADKGDTHRVWMGTAHKMWLSRANRLIEKVPDVSIKDMITVLGAL